MKAILAYDQVKKKSPITQTTISDINSTLPALEVSTFDNGRNDTFEKMSMSMPFILDQQSPRLLLRNDKVRPSIEL